MKYLPILTAIFLTYFFIGCKKDNGDVSPEIDEFSFYYNGQKFNYSITANVANAGVAKGADGNPDIHIYMTDVFNGTIRFLNTGCAFLEPPFNTVSVGQGCILSSVDSLGNSIPIDSIKVFIYQSGTSNVSFTNCVRKSGFDIITGLNYQYDDCAASGTFDLTLSNKNDSTIKITNGIVKFHHVIVR